MAISVVPSTFFGAGYTLASSKAEFTTATSGGTVLLSKLTDAEANATTGDYREISWSIAYMLWQKWNAVLPANRPAKMSITKTVVANTDLTTQQETYVLTFQTTVDPTSVAAE